MMIPLVPLACAQLELTNAIIITEVELSSENGSQWIEVFNPTSNEISLSTIHINSSDGHMLTSLGGLSDLQPKHYELIDLQSAEKLTWLNTNSIITIYPYPPNTIVNGQNSTVLWDKTPPLSDSYLDSRTWQFNGTQWIFEEQTPNGIPTKTIKETLDVLSPLKQFKSGIPFYKIKCISGLQLTQRYDGYPACVKHDTYFELIKRDWGSNIIKAVQSRDVSDTDPRSSHMEKVIPTLDEFKETLSKSDDIKMIFSKFGSPHNDIGSGIHIYVYELDDSTQIWIGYSDRIWYARHVDLDGNILEQLLEENKN